MVMDLLESAPCRRSMRPEIAAGWHRAALYGLDQSGSTTQPGSPRAPRSGRLTDSARPVLDALDLELRDTPFTVLLADHDAIILERRGGTSSSLRALDDVSAVPGACFSEQFTGVNALASAHELRRPIAVIGDEHYLESLRRFCCFGAPIIHPITRRLEGVLDISGPADERTALLKPFLLSAAAQIRQRLVDGTKNSDKRILLAFQEAASRRRAGVVAMGENVILTNLTATDLLRSEDHATLRGLTENIPASGRELRTTIQTASGATLDVEARGIPGASGLICILSPSEQGGAVDRGQRRTVANHARVRPRVTLITGEPGTGRTTTALDVAGTEAALFEGLDSADESWLPAVFAALESNRSTVIENIESLTARAALVLRNGFRRTRGTVVLTSPPIEHLTGEHAALAATALSRQQMQPLREYGSTFADIVRSIVHMKFPQSDVRFTASAIEVLATQPWPGNLHEMVDVISAAVRHRSSGDVTERDLPETHASRPPGRLTKLERVERDTIIAVLQSVNGNKVAAATELGIGRTTLYKRLRHYRIPA